MTALDKAELDVKFHDINSDYLDLKFSTEISVGDTDLGANSITLRLNSSVLSNNFIL